MALKLSDKGVEEVMVSFLGEKKCHASMEHKVPGARFFSEISRCSIIRIELDEPTKNMVLYDLYDTDIKPMDVSSIPPGAYPYPNCLFVSTCSVYVVIQRVKGCGKIRRGNSEIAILPY